VTNVTWDREHHHQSITIATLQWLLMQRQKSTGVDVPTGQIPCQLVPAAYACSPVHIQPHFCGNHCHVTLMGTVGVSHTAVGNSPNASNSSWQSAPRCPARGAYDTHMVLRHHQAHGQPVQPGVSCSACIVYTLHLFRHVWPTMVKHRQCQRHPTP
jgi:hypothetical protein